MRTVAVTAGHGGSDPGAIANGAIERDLMTELRDLVAIKLRATDMSVRTDGARWQNLPLVHALTLVPGSVTINNGEQKANLKVEGDTIRIAGEQQDSSNWMHTYNVTDSDTDPLCRVPNYGRNQGGFVGLAKNYKYVPAIGGKADDWAGMIVNNAWVDPFKIKLADYWIECQWPSACKTSIV